MPVGLVDVEVQRDHQVQLLQRRREAGPVDAAQHRVAGQHEERPQLPLAGRGDLVGHDRRRPGAHHVGEPADPAALRVVAEPAGLLGRLLERHHRLAEEHPALAVQVAGQQREGVDQHADQRGVLAQTGAGAPVDGRTRCRREGASQGAHHVRIDPGAGRRRLRGEGLHRREQRLRPDGLAGDGLLVDEPLLGHHLDQRGQQERVAVGLDRDVLEGPGGLAAPRVDHDDAAASGHDGREVLLHARGTHPARPRDQRVRTEHQQQVGAPQVGERHLGDRPVEQLAGDVPAVDVLAADGVLVAGAERRHQRARPQRAADVEADRVAEELSDRAATVDVDQCAQPGGDVVERLLPGDLLELPRRRTGHPAQRVQHPVGVVLDLREGQPLGAGVPPAQRVLVVGPQRDQAAVLDGRDHPAERLADAAVGGDGRPGHRDILEHVLLLDLVFGAWSCRSTTTSACAP